MTSSLSSAEAEKCLKEMFIERHNKRFDTENVRYSPAPCIYTLCFVFLNFFHGVICAYYCL